MRTTLNLDDDALQVAKALAAREQCSLGAVVSEMIRRSVEPNAVEGKERNGIPLFPVSAKAKLVTPEIIAELLDEA